MQHIELSDEDALYRATESKDARFDGVFFVAVDSTGIYCRPVCPARTPKRSVCTFFRYAFEAEQAGFRACFRCRPERAPGSSSMDANSRLVAQAVTVIHEGYLNEHSVQELAERLHVTARHLRRTLQKELGVTASVLAQSRRLALAKQLIQDTTLSMTDVAFASGFSSVRRFNTAFREHFGRTPSSLRRQNEHLLSEPTSICVHLDYRPPLDWQQWIEYRQRRLMQGVESIERQTYTRALTWGKHTGWVQLAPQKGKASLKAHISLSFVQNMASLLLRLRKAFDLDAHPIHIAEHLEQDPMWSTLSNVSLQGSRIPGSLEPFAALVRIILGQRISVQAATTLCNRLIRAQGTPFSTPHTELTHLFPTPKQLAQCTTDELAALGIRSMHAETIQTLARAVEEGHIDLSTHQPSTELFKHLHAIRGIGPWTIQYTQMRIFGFPDIFPSSDLELRKALGGCTAKEAEQHAERWRPWRSYAALALWNRNTPSSR